MSDLSRSSRRLRSAELLSVGSEITVGETRDTNAGELARSLTDAGVTVGRLTAVPDVLETVAEAFRSGLERADLVVSTGGLGPTPDDLTREAIAHVWGEATTVDPGLEAWLRELWARRGLPFPELNRKQAWLIPSAVALPNPHGTAPGWFVTRPDGRVAVALPGPPREMRPMWAEHALPRLRQQGLGQDMAARTFRLAGIGESQVAELLGDALLRGRNPDVATYARAEAVDVRVSAIGAAGRSAEAIVAEAAETVERLLGRYVWATGTTTWSEAIGAALAERGWQLGLVEIGTRGQVQALLGDVPWVALAETRGGDGRVGSVPMAAGDADDDGAGGLLADARAIRVRAGAEVGLAVRARERGADTAVSVAIATPDGDRGETRNAFLGGSHGRTRAALLAAASLLEALRHREG